MNIKLTLPTKLTDHLMQTKGDRSLAAYIVIVLNEYHSAKEATNEKGNTTTRSYDTSNP